MTTVLIARRHEDWILQAPRLIRARLTPARAVVGIALAVLVISPTALYLAERGRHIETRRAHSVMNVSSAAEMSYLRHTILELLDERTQLTNTLLESGGTIYSRDKVLVKVVATGYSSSVFETDNTPFVTAANTPTREGIVALSRDLLNEFTPGAPFSFGARVHVSGLGDFLVEDVMNARWTNRIVVWFPSRSEAIRFGARELYLSGTADENRPSDTDILSENACADIPPAGM